MDIDYDADDLEEAVEHNPDRYEGEARIEGTVDDMLANLDDQE